MALSVKRIYEPSSPRDGSRVLVDRLWPRGITKEAAAVDRWMKELAPSAALRQWFGHDPARWEGFKRKYFKELDGQRALVSELSTAAKKGRVTLLFAAKDEFHNNAVALKEYLTHR